MPATTRSKKPKRLGDPRKKIEEKITKKKRSLDVYLLAEAVTCTVCKLFLRRPVQLKPCAHVFCNACISKWLMRKQTCPCCRAKPQKLVNDMSLQSILSKFRDCASESFRESLHCDREGITCEMITCEEMSIENLFEKFERLFHHVYHQQISSRMDRVPLLRFLHREEQSRGSQSRSSAETNVSSTSSDTNSSNRSQERSSIHSSVTTHSARSNGDRRNGDGNIDTSGTFEDLVPDLPAPYIVNSSTTLRSSNVSSSSSSGSSAVSDRRPENNESQENFEFEGVPIAPGDVPDFPRVVILGALGSQGSREQRNRRVLSRTGSIFM